MEKYSKYKNSGILEVGDIPIDWEVWKLGHAYNNCIGSGTTPESGNSEYHDNGTINWLNTGDLNNSMLYSCSKKVTEKALKDYSALKIYPKNSLVIAMYGATIGKVSIIDFETTVNQACCVFTESEIILNKFLFYWFIANLEYVVNLSKGGGQPNISKDILSNIKIPCPDTTLQFQICNFLDQKTIQLDKLIIDKENLINILREELTAVIYQAITKGLNPSVPTKDSGIEWIGKIPKHWDLKKIKHVNKKIGSGITPKGGAEVYEDSGIQLLRSQNIYFDGLRLDDVAYISEEIHESMSNSKVFPLDVLLNITGGSIGRCFYVSNEFIEANVNQHVCIIRPNEKILTGYLYNILRSEIGQLQIDICQTGGNRESLNFEQLKNFVFPLPDTDEQREILNYINFWENSLNDLIQKTQSEIELLKEYKTSLISEVVTGKVDIRDEVISQSFATA